MDLLQKVFYISAMHKFEIDIHYVNTKINGIADALIRLQFDRCHQHASDTFIHE